MIASWPGCTARTDPVDASHATPRPPPLLILGALVTSPPPADTLPLRLRQATQALHTATEQAGVMARLLAGELAHEGYLDLLVNLRGIYDALEQALRDNAHQAWLSGFDLIALRRGPALAADLAPWSNGPLRAGSLTQATQAYAQRLSDLGQAASPALLAHVYTRYLGDLHGGQILQRIVRRLYPSQGTAFHDFGDAQQVKRLREQLRQGLAGVALTPAQAEQVVEEACWSFRQHRSIFEALPGPARTR